MPRAPKKCAGCEVRIVGRTYCPDCTRRLRRPSPSSLNARSARERARRSAVVAAWVRANGWLCPGYERPAHPSRDLTAAHAVAVAHGGSQIDGVLCRSCNSRQNTKPA